MDFAADPEAVDRLRLITGATIAELEELGRQARSRGCLRNDTEKVHEMVEGTFVSILRRVGRGWQDIDGRIPRGEEDDAGRYTVGTNWDRNSCAVDSALFCGLMLDAGRIQIDQLAPSSRGKLGEPALILRRIVASPWGLLTQRQRDELRNVLGDGLDRADADRFRRGRFQDVIEVVQACFHRLPQVSFTEVRASRCCDGHMVVSEGQAAERTAGFYLPGNDGNASVQEMMERILGPKPTSVSTRCSRQNECTGTCSRFRLVLDRMPPTLLLYLPRPISEKANDVWRLFERLDVAYQDTRGGQTIQYEPVGCVMFVHGNHFVVRWKAKGEDDGIIEYDGMSGAEVSVVANWWKGLSKRKGKTSAGVLAMFYRQI